MDVLHGTDSYTMEPDCLDALHARASRPATAAAAGSQQHVSLPDATTLLKTKIALAINRLMATYLAQLEQLGDEHDEAMGKLMDALPVEHRASVHLADIYGEVRFDAIRRAVLKAGNDGRRELDEHVDYLRLERLAGPATKDLP